MAKYRKLIVALLGFLVIAGMQFGIEVPIDPQGFTDLLITFSDQIVALITALGVYAVPNATE
jgi:hypothetical protein